MRFAAASALRVTFAPIIWLVPMRAARPGHYRPALDEHPRQAAATRLGGSPAPKAEDRGCHAAWSVAP
jgi:hypothetical protein